MKARHLLAAAIVAGLAAPVAAQSVSFDDVDANGDDRLDSSELVTSFGADGAVRVLALQDSDDDGAILRGEGARQQTAMASVTHRGIGTPWDDADNGD